MTKMVENCPFLMHFCSIFPSQIDITTTEYDYPTFHLSMQCYLCSLLNGSLTLLGHEAAAWLDREHLRSVQWLPADELILSEIESKL